jgi:cysteine synthase A
MNPGKKVLTIFPDHGIRYMQTIFEPTWLNERTEELKRDWSHPVLVDSPTAVGRDWQYFPWQRRSYREVMGHDPVSR